MKIQISKHIAMQQGKYEYYSKLSTQESPKFLYCDTDDLTQEDVTELKNTPQLHPMTGKIAPAPPEQNKPNTVVLPKPTATGCNLEGFENGPGSFIHNIIKTLTGESFSPMCGCCKRVLKLNEEGWISAIKNAKEIKTFLLDESKKRNLAPEKLEDSWSNFLLTGAKMIAKNTLSKCCGQKDCKKE